MKAQPFAYAEPGYVHIGVTYSENEGISAYITPEDAIEMGKRLIQVAHVAKMKMALTGQPEA